MNEMIQQTLSAHRSLETIESRGAFITSVFRSMLRRTLSAIEEEGAIEKYATIIVQLGEIDEE